MLKNRVKAVVIFVAEKENSNKKIDKCYKKLIKFLLNKNVLSHNMQKAQKCAYLCFDFHEL